MEKPNAAVINLTYERLEEIIEWANENPWFDQKFILRVYDLIEKDCQISMNQVYGVDAIYQKFLL
jgi:hypothetical protein